MKKPRSGSTPRSESGGQPETTLTDIEKSASALVRLVKRVRAAQEAADDAVGAHAAIKELRDSLVSLQQAASQLLSREPLFAEKADKQFLELESAVRGACSKRGWRVDGIWPTLYVERAIAVEVFDAKRSIVVAGKKLAIATADAVVLALDPIVRELLPKGFSAREFMRDLATAYDTTRGASSQLPVFDLYRGMVVHAQTPQFWRNAKADAFHDLSADQFRARLTAALESGVTTAPDDREIRLLPPLNSKDGLFMYQPAESRYGFVGRVEFMPVVRGKSE